MSRETATLQTEYGPVQVELETCPQCGQQGARWVGVALGQRQPPPGWIGVTIRRFNERGAAVAFQRVVCGASCLRDALTEFSESLPDDEAAA